MTALSGLARGFGPLALARLGVGAGEASAAPAAYSLLSDWFPRERRGAVLGIFSSGIFIGAGLISFSHALSPARPFDKFTLPVVGIVSIGLGGLFVLPGLAGVVQPLFWFTAKVIPRDWKDRSAARCRRPTSCGERVARRCAKAT